MIAELYSTTLYIAYVVIRIQQNTAHGRKKVQYQNNNNIITLVFIRVDGRAAPLRPNSI